MDRPGADVAEYQQLFEQSGRLGRRASGAVAGGTSHDSRQQHPWPIYVARAHGARKWTVEGRCLVDYWMGHGALLCGHAFPPVIEAVTQQLARGLHYGAAHVLEIEWAERVCALIPSAERVRFTNSGTEATLLSLRVARAFTGKPRILKLDGHFHGWHDEALCHYLPETAGLNAGTTQYVDVVPPDRLDEIEEVLSAGETAALLLEPGGGGAGAMPTSREFLVGLRELTRRYDALLIFDEVVSGFRVTPGGVQALHGVAPDLSALGKILVGGLPGGAVAGRAEVMEVFSQRDAVASRVGRVVHSGTFNANPVSAAAGVAMLQAVGDGTPQAAAQAAAAKLARLVNAAAAARGVDVTMYTGGTSVVHLMIGARAAGLPIGPSLGAIRLYQSQGTAYEELRRRLLLEGVDMHPLHGWVSAVHDEQIVQQSAQAFDRAFHALRLSSRFSLPAE